MKIKHPTYERTPPKPGIQNIRNHVKKYWCNQLYIFSSCLDYNLIVYLQNNPKFRIVFPTNAELFNAKNRSLVICSA